LVLATHYEGDPTDNAKAFHKWLKKNNKNELLKGMEYSIMGLGDTSYEQFNEMAVFCDKSLTEMGAKRLYQVGAANAETYTTEDDYIKWR
jgi:NADPH-ferrihemoprotein reductase